MKRHLTTLLYWMLMLCLGTASLHARYLNPNTGRFTTMDSYEGNNQDPQTLHKYLYCQASPTMFVDHSGHNGDSISLGTAMTIGAAVGATTTYYANLALGRAQTFSSIFMGASWGMVLGPYAAAIPEVGLGLGAWGIYDSSSIVYQVYNDPNATATQKASAVGLVVASIWGSKVAVDYYNAVRINPPRVSATDAAPTPEFEPEPAIPEFPLPLRAPSGIRIRSMTQNKLRKGSVENIPGIIESMLHGKPIDYIAGFRSGNTYWINEGHHRMTAALEIYNKTGDASHVNKLLQEGNWKTGTPSLDYQMTLEGGAQ